MPELSHLYDIDTGLRRVSTKSKLHVISKKKMIIYDKYCAVLIKLKEVNENCLYYDKLK